MSAMIVRFLEIALDLEKAGLIWQPEIGDEVSDRRAETNISILVDPQGLSPSELRQTYLWLPSVEQIVAQFEARQSMLFHTGLELTQAKLCYKTVVQSPFGPIESLGESMRVSLGSALKELLVSKSSAGMVH